MPLVVGVDSSTSACKVEVRDADTGAAGRVRSGPAPADDAAPQRAGPAGLVDGVRGRLRRGRRLRTGTSPAAIAIGGQQHGLVVLDADGEVLRPAKLWNDTESAPDAERAGRRAAGGAAAWAEACGSVPVASFTITKLAWLRRCEPDTLRVRSRPSCSPTTGSPPSSPASAPPTAATPRAPATGRPPRSATATDLLALVDASRRLGAVLPEVLGPTEAAGEWAETGAVVGPGTGDNMAAALGLGLRPGDLALSLGTSGTAFTVSDQPSADRTGTVAGFADATGRFLPLVCTLNATKVTDTVARLLGVDTERLRPARARRAARAPAASCSSPTSTASAPRTDPTPPERSPACAPTPAAAQLARAAVEGVVANLLAGADALERGMTAAYC